MGLKALSADEGRYDRAILQHPRHVGHRDVEPGRVREEITWKKMSHVYVEAGIPCIRAIHFVSIFRN